MVLKQHYLTDMDSSIGEVSNNDPEDGEDGGRAASTSNFR